MATITVWTLIIVGDNEDSTSVSLHPSEAAALGHLRELYDIPEWVEDVVDAVNNDPVITNGEEVRFVMLDSHDHYC
ncbi:MULTISPECIES: hypothetical protein [Mycolicibacterium]|uniref:hypothetical protein n=1 Tax=Mycolicibacterium TaxID=1866885 RepID=UPI0011633139|nr:MULTISPECIES: hypothetical protein [Mycolicibacterium]MCC9181052.1 hypothetical protein [Mycolicibacterium mageritense]QDF19331.1 hypothetical protein SEA_CRACKLEWINK_45 [Mycobacterium phage Cracklewink]UBV14772.1 hypothetical protein H8Z57_29420 [Mycolicibacterium fortuitum]